ncbi:hypothetical protein QUB75_29920 [Microcoleus sp. K1-B6]|uniref:hypothetical protein n=1 Tax=unclassified Microcoleus TaxID=2642155 RepID=UPI002FCEFAFA
MEDFEHFVDWQINRVDAGGDEGEVFSVLVRDENFESEKLQQMKAEDDTANITLDGEVVPIKQVTVSDSGDFKGSHKPIEYGSKNGKDGGTVQSRERS